VDKAKPFDIPKREAHCLACDAPVWRSVASFNLLPTGVHRRGRRWGRSAWRHETNW
jgi:hypothetical protein